MADLFDAYVKAYAQQNHTFTIQEFVVLILSGEFDSIVESTLYNDSSFRWDVAHAATHWLYINQQELSVHALLNWLGAMDSARSRYQAWNGSKTLSGPGRGQELAWYVMNMMINPPAEWKRTEGNYWNNQWDPVNQHPYTWGNRSLWSVDPASKLAQLGYPTPIRTIGGANPWYLLTLAQSSALNPYRR